MKKRGKFFLMAAIVIIVIIISLEVVYNNVRAPKEEIQVYDLSKEIDFEASKVIETGIFSGNENQISSQLKNLADSSSNFSPDQDFIIVYGNSALAKIIYYENVGRERESITTLYSADIKEGDFTNTNSVMLEIENNPYHFQLSDTQNFYIVITQDNKDEK